MVVQGDVIKHKNFRDVALKILEVKRIDSILTTKLRCLFLNMGFVETYSMGELITLEVTDYQLAHEYLRCSEPEAKCIRNVEWSDI